MFIKEVCILLILNFLGIRCVWALIEDFLYAFDFYLNKERQQGIVTGFKTKQDLDQNDGYAPIIKYTAADGKEYVIESDNYSFEKPHIGKVELVYYEKDDPTNAMVNLERRIGVRFFVVILMLAMVIGLDWILIPEVIN